MAGQDRQSRLWGQIWLNFGANNRGYEAEPRQFAICRKVSGQSRKQFLFWDLRPKKAIASGCNPSGCRLQGEVCQLQGEVSCVFKRNAMMDGIQQIKWGLSWVRKNWKPKQTIPPTTLLYKTCLLSRLNNRKKSYNRLLVAETLWLWMIGIDTLPKVNTIRLW